MKVIDTVLAIVSILGGIVGAFIGAATGFENGGWMGAIAIGAVGAVIGAAVPLLLRSGMPL